jgi:uncharacterized protein (TIGR03435 family)
LWRTPGCEWKEASCTWRIGAAGDAGAARFPSSPNLSNVFAALEEQLGLNLSPSKGPVELLVIERAERPSAN